MRTRTIHSTAARIAIRGGTHWKGFLLRWVAAALYSVGCLLRDHECLYDLGFMIWQRELSPLPPSLGKRLIVSAARQGSHAANELASLFTESVESGRK